MRNIYNGTNELGDKYIPPPNPPPKITVCELLLEVGGDQSKEGAYIWMEGGHDTSLPTNLVYAFIVSIYLPIEYF